MVTQPETGEVSGGMTKRCTKCGIELPNTEEYFYRRGKAKASLYTRCRSCCRAYSKLQAEAIAVRNKAWRFENRECIRANKKAAHEAKRTENLARMRAYHSTHKDEYKVRGLRNRARSRGLPGLLTVNEYRAMKEWFGGRCAYCGIDVSQTNFWHETKFHADHYIPLSANGCPGTVVGNIVPACNVCNSIKHANEPVAWITATFGKRKAKQIIARIELYFASVTESGRVGVK